MQHASQAASKFRLGKLFSHQARFDWGQARSLFITSKQYILSLFRQRTAWESSESVVTLRTSVFVHTVSQRNLLVVSRETACTTCRCMTPGKPVTTLSVTVRQIFRLYCMLHVHAYSVPRFSFARELE